MNNERRLPVQKKKSAALDVEATSEKEIKLAQIFKNKSDLAKFNGYDGEAVQEKRYGHFIRKYLSFLIQDTAGDFYKYMGIEGDADRFELCLYTLNPGQMEMAALLLITDLGFVPEIGIANSLDSIDVRGRLPEKYQASPQVVLDRIDKNGFSMSDEIKRKILNQRVIEIQCKAYQFNQSNPRTDIIFMTPTSVAAFAGINWSLETIKDKFESRIYITDKNADWYLLNNWLLNLIEGFSRKGAVIDKAIKIAS